MPLDRRDFQRLENQRVLQRVPVSSDRHLVSQLAGLGIQLILIVLGH